jgi:hypothetical protein
VPVPMAARSKARTVFGRSNTGIVGYNPARVTDVCAFLCCVVLCGQRPCVGLIPRPRSPTKCP